MQTCKPQHQIIGAVELKMTPQQFNSRFIEIKDDLLSFLYRLLANKQDGEDVVQESYLRAMDALHTYDPEKASVKTWVFTIALNIAKNKLKRLKRWNDDYLDIAKKFNTSKPEKFKQTLQAFHATPDAVFEMKEHLNYCFMCISKTLDLHQQICLWLKEVYGFKQKEIMAITNLTEGKVKHSIADGRNHMKRIFNNRCALINKNGVCTQCTELNNIFNPKQDAHIESKKLKLSKHEIDHDKLLDLRFEIVKNTNPLSAKSSLHLYFAENIENWVELSKKKK